jgi:hypothetical protein
MEFNAKDNEIIQLLTSLKDVNGEYPPEMLASRRQGYLKQVAEISAGVGLALALKNTVKTANGAGGAPLASTLLEALLVVAIVAEASTVAYFYRDTVADFFRSFSNTPRVEEVSGPLLIETPFPTFELTVTPTGTEMATQTATPIATSSFEVAAEATQKGDNRETGQSLSTPASTDNNGNQFGLTPKPVRTKKPVTNDSETDSNKKK